MMYLVSHTYTEDELQGIIKQVEDLITKYGGTSIVPATFEKHKLAYAIGQLYHGYHVLTYFEMPNDGVSQLTNALRLTDEIVRHIIVLKENYEPKNPQIVEIKEDVLQHAADVVRQATKSKEEAVKAEDVTVAKEDSEKKDVENQKEEKAASPVQEEKVEEPAKEAEAPEPKTEENSDEEKPKKKKITMEDLDKTLDDLTKIDESLL